MDPITHTITGAALSEAGLRRTTPLATATLIVAANAPDVDIAAQLLGPYTALAWRRGITHGVPALLALPLFVAGAILLVDRAFRRRVRPESRPARPGPVLALSFLGVWTHPWLDWLNTYGMRWWLPLDGSWSYGDALFIVDPWLWLILGGGLFMRLSRGPIPIVLWATLGFSFTVLVAGSGLAPAGAVTLWTLGIAAWILLRWRVADSRSEPGSGEGLVRATLALSGVYVFLMVVLTPVSERLVLAEADQLGVGPVQEVMVGPVPATPFQGQVVLRLREEYRTGDFSWFARPRLHLHATPLPSHPRDEVVRAAERHPDLRDFLVWSRFPRYQVRPTGEGWEVEVSDARYRGGGVSGGLGGLTVELDRRLLPRSGGP